MESKIIEKVMHRILFANQFGFRKNNSTSYGFFFFSYIQITPYNTKATEPKGVTGHFSNKNWLALPLNDVRLYLVENIH